MLKYVLGVLCTLFFTGALAAEDLTPHSVRQIFQEKPAGEVINTLSKGGRLDQIFDRIGKGRPEWVMLAGLLAEGTDAGTSMDLTISLARALPINPFIILSSLRDDDSILGIERVCSAPFVEPSKEEQIAYLKSATDALSALRSDNNRTAIIDSRRIQKCLNSLGGAEQIVRTGQEPPKPSLDPFEVAHADLKKCVDRVFTDEITLTADEQTILVNIRKQCIREGENFTVAAESVKLTRNGSGSYSDEFIDIFYKYFKTQNDFNINKIIETINNFRRAAMYCPLGNKEKLLAEAQFLTTGVVGMSAAYGHVKSYNELIGGEFVVPETDEELLKEFAKGGPDPYCKYLREELTAVFGEGLFN